MSMFSHFLVPRKVRRTIHPLRTAQHRLTPKPIRRASYSLWKVQHPVHYAVYSGAHKLAHPSKPAVKKPVPAPKSPKLAPQDITWSRFNKDIEEAIAIGDMWQVCATYYLMAEFVESEGSDGTYLRQKAYELKKQLQHNELIRSRDNGSKKIEILTNKGCCELCQNQNGLIVDVNEAINTDLLPIKDCTGQYGCRCTYLPVV